MINIVQKIMRILIYSLASHDTDEDLSKSYDSMISNPQNCRSPLTRDNNCCDGSLIVCLCVVTVFF